MITMDGKYQGRDGQNVRILCIDGRTINYPVVAYVDTELAIFDREGFRYGPDSKCSTDLVEVKSPEYVPYDDSDRDEVRGKWIKSKKGNSQYQITSFNAGAVQNMAWDFAFDNWTYLDGSIFGKVKK